MAYFQLLNLIRLMKKNKNIFKNKRIIVTGHTGFKGSWLVTWLTLLGAKVTGISNNIPTNPSHFKYLKLKNKVDNCKLDIRNLKKLKKIFKSKKPDYVFHLAAQSLVKKSYLNPKYTLIEQQEEVERLACIEEEQKILEQTELENAFQEELKRKKLETQAAEKITKKVSDFWDQSN